MLFDIYKSFPALISNLFSSSSVNSVRHVAFVLGLLSHINFYPVVALSSIHTIWVREHNRIAMQLHFLNPSWPGTRLFDEARKIIGAMMQHITYNEFLTAMLGPNNVSLVFLLQYIIFASGTFCHCISLILYLFSKASVRNYRLNSRHRRILKKYYKDICKLFGSVFSG